MSIRTTSVFSIHQNVLRFSEGMVAVDFKT